MCFPPGLPALMLTLWLHFGYSVTVVTSFAATDGSTEMSEACQKFDECDVALALQAEWRA
jgi:hypothetical protein